MNNDAKIGLGLVGAMALCCGGPLILSALASGAALGALGALWEDGRLAMLGGGTVLIVAAVWLLAGRLASRKHADAGCCDASVPTIEGGHADVARVHGATGGNTTTAVAKRDRIAAD